MQACYSGDPLAGAGLDRVLVFDIGEGDANRTQDVSVAPQWAAEANALGWSAAGWLAVGVL